MKRAGYLIGKIADPNNLRIAFWKAAKGKRHRPEVMEFANNLQVHLNSLQSQILNGTVEVGIHHFFTVFDPKERRICAACFRERVLHHAIMNVCEPVFDSFQVHDSYACRKEKGNLKAVHRARHFTSSFRYFFFFDIEKFYDSVNHEILINRLCRKFKDGSLIALFEKIITAYHVKPGCGLPIGHLTSQHLGNFYLAHLDHFIKDELRIKGFVRYMDDMVIWEKDIHNLKTVAQQVREHAATALKLNVKDGWIMNRTLQGCDFLGYRVFPGNIRLSRKSRDRFRRKMNQYLKLHKSGSIGEREFQIRLDALFSFVRNADTLSYRKALLAFSGYDQKLEPREPRRQLEQHGRELPVGEPQQEFAGQPQQQPRLPRGPAFNSMVDRHPEGCGQGADAPDH